MIAAKMQLGNLVLGVDGLDSIDMSTAPCQMQCNLSSDTIFISRGGD